MRSLACSSLNFLVGELREYIFKRIVTFVLDGELAFGSVGSNVEVAKFNSAWFDNNLRRVDCNALNGNLEFNTCCALECDNAAVGAGFLRSINNVEF